MLLTSLTKVTLLCSVTFFIVKPGRDLLAHSIPENIRKAFR